MIVLIGVDGCGTSFDINRSKAPNLCNFFNNGSLIYVTANIPTDSAENWGSILTGVVPEKHKLKYENLNKPYSNEDYPSIFKIILNHYKNYKVAAFVAWHPIITGMIENSLNMDRYAPTLNESCLSKIYMHINHYWFNNPIYDNYLVHNLLNYIKKNKDLDFLFIHLVDLDEIGHIYGFDSKNYFEYLEKTDNNIKKIIDVVEKYLKGSLILITTDHGGLGKKHGGNSNSEKNVFIGSNANFIFNDNITSNMHCSKLILEYFKIIIPKYFDYKSQ